MPSQNDERVRRNRMQQSLRAIESTQPQDISDMLISLTGGHPSTERFAHWLHDQREKQSRGKIVRIIVAFENLGLDTITREIEIPEKQTRGQELSKVIRDVFLDLFAHVHNIIIADESPAIQVETSRQRSRRQNNYVTGQEE